MSKSNNVQKEDIARYVASPKILGGPLKIQRRENMGFGFSANRPGYSEFCVN